MNLIIDGLIFESQTHGGISRIFDNILPRMCAIDPDLIVNLFHHWNIDRKLPQHNQIRTIGLNRFDQLFRPWRIWHKTYPTLHNLYLQCLLGSTKGKIWFSSYYSVPPFIWRGYQVVFAHDFIHEMFPSSLSDSLKTIESKQQSIQRADAIICNSNVTARDIHRYYDVPEEKVFVAELGYNDIFNQRTLDELGKKHDYGFILYLGKRKYYKGFDTLLSAFNRWDNKNEIKLLVVGSSWSKEEEDFITQNNLKNQIILLNGVDDDQLCDLYNQTQAFVYPSLYEGFGIPLLEAMSCGCPIVASQIPSTLEVAQEIPYYFEPGNVEGLINALNKAIASGRESEQILKGLSRVRQFSWDQTARKVLDVLRHVAEHS